MEHQLVPLSESALYQELLSKPALILTPPVLQDIAIIPLQEPKAPSVQELEDLQSFLSTVLENWVGLSPEQSDLFLTPDAMKIWITAFTHKSYNLNQNYERLEKYGDALVKVAFVKYLLEYPIRLSEADISNLSNHYMAKYPQSQLAKSIGLGQFIRTHLPISIPQLEDLFESFAGALDEIADKYTDLRGDKLVYNFIYNIFTAYPIDLKVALGDPKTRVVQLFAGRGWGVPETKKFHSPEGVSIEIYATPRSHGDLSKIFPGTRKLLLGRGKGTTETVAEKQAYSQALSLLEEHGVFGQEKAVLPEVRADYERALKRAQTEGYTEIYPIKVWTKDTEQIEGLVGVRANGEETILLLGHAGSKKNRNDIARALYVAYQ